MTDSKYIYKIVILPITLAGAPFPVTFSMLIRLQKYLADHGIASRRKCEEYITSGLIKVNGSVVTKLGSKVDPDKDVIETPPDLKMRTARFVYYAFHKPVGYTCTVTGQERPSIMELLSDIPERVFPVGRLDKLSSGLLLLTSDGRFSYELTHPGFQKEKEYSVKVREKISAAALAILSESFFIAGRKTAPAKIVLKGPHRFHVILTEGRNRQIRRMCKRAGLHIERLKRIRIGSLTLGTLAPGQYRRMTQNEIRMLSKNPLSS